MPTRSDNKKLKLMAAESDDDRISALPDEMIHCVLSFLPPHEAVQTCLLSRRWRGIWKSMPVLRIKDPRFWESPAKFNKFVNHFLFFRDLSPLEEFDVMTYPSFHPCLSLMKAPVPLEPVRYLDMWIRYALMRKVRVLRVRVRRSHFARLFNLPLISHFARLFNLPLISQHLLTLELCCLVLDGCSVDFSRCPLLEDLEISNCYISGHKMMSQSIRHLCITSCHFADNATRLEILAPNLFALELRETEGLIPFLGSMPLLVTAFVGLQTPSFIEGCWQINHGDSCRLDPHIVCYGSEKCVVLGGLTNATSLQLEVTICKSLENIFKQDLKWCLPFSKLKTLILNGWAVGLAGCDVRGLIRFLQLAPILEKLILEIYDELTFEKKIDERCSLAEQFIPTKHLKIVEVSCHKDVQNIHKLVETLVACGIPPDIINVRRHNHFQEKRLFMTRFSGNK